jgi:hypothetical protein
MSPTALMKMGIIAIGLSSEGGRPNGKVKTTPIAKSTLGKARKTCRFIASTRSRLRPKLSDRLAMSVARNVEVQFIHNRKS